MRHSYLLILLLALAQFAFALEVLSPVVVNNVQENSVLELGAIGPGQTISLEINPHLKEGGKFGQGGRYDYATVSGLPFGWKAKDSKLYGDPLQVEISADPNAEEGNYTAKVTVHDENNGESLGEISFLVQVKITRDVLDMVVSPTSQTVGSGQPARYAITITNKGTASDVFIVSTEGVDRWIFEKHVFVPAQSSKTVTYEISENEQARYVPLIKVVSTSSPIIHKEERVVFNVQSDLLSDFKATSHGIFVFPIFEAPAYAIAGLLSNLW
jgi:hypothetical protein